MSEFKDKVVIITGASEGIGRSLAHEFAPMQARLVLAARNVERLNSLKAEVEAAGGQAIVVPTDVTDEAACKQLIDTTVSTYGQIDVLVCNAGGTMWTPMEAIVDTSIYERLMKLNYLGSVYPCFYALPHLKRTMGRIVGISSVAGLIGVPTRTAYSASKHAMFGFFDSLRIEVQESGITVTMIAPDFVLSEIHRRALGADGKAIGKSPLQESKIMTSQACAQLAVEAIFERKRLLITSRRGKIGRWLKLLMPKKMDAIALKAIREKK